MVNHHTDVRDGHRGRANEPPGVAPALVAEIVMAGDGQKECTIFPPDSTGHDRLIRWITAGEGSYVHLAEMR